MAIKAVAIIGAGPVGLAAAAHSLERGLSPIILEQGPTAGYAIRRWAHVPMFSPWAFNVDAAAERLLAKSGWTRPDPDRYPTGGDLVSDYVAPLAEKTALRERIRYNAEVISVSRVGFDKVKSAGREAAPFLLRYRNGEAVSKLTADAVIDTSGTWFSPNPAGAGGLPATGESEAARRISYGMPDVLGEARSRYAGKRVAVLGGGHSAIGSLIALAELQMAAPSTEVTWLYRGAVLEKAFGGGAADQLSARGDLGIEGPLLRHALLMALGNRLPMVVELRACRGDRISHCVARPALCDGERDDMDHWLFPCPGSFERSTRRRPAELTARSDSAGADCLEVRMVEAAQGTWPWRRHLTSLDFRRYRSPARGTTNADTCDFTAADVGRASARQ